MKEDLLHFIWQSKRLFTQTLKTVDGKIISVIHPGQHNADAGPDFFNAKITIDDTLWAGNVEIHIRSSDWNAHGHQHDKNYDNVILHVVFHHDKTIFYSNGTEVPTLELKQLLPPFLLKRYEKLQHTEKTIPCEDIWLLPSDIVLQNWLSRLLTERMENKTAYLHTLLNTTNQNWEQAFYVFTAKYFGMKVNAQPFEWLALQLPLQVIARHKNNAFQLEALVFGIAGLIHEPDFPELHTYQKEFSHLALKYDLKPLSPKVWKFSKTRPSNFPDVRLKQFAALLFHSSHLFSKILAAETIKELHALYHINENDKRLLSDDAIDLLLLNSVLPALFHYGKTMQKPELCERAIDFYEQIKPESNTVTRFWKKLGVPVKSAFDAQAVIQLKTHYCDEHKCLNCAIGQHLLLHESTIKS